MLDEISKIVKTIIGKSESKKLIKLIGKKKVIKYDGNCHQVSGFENETYTLNNKTYFVRYNSYEIWGKDAGTYYPELKGKISIVNSKGKDVTEKFTIEIVRGELLIEKRNVVFKSASGEHEYDGKSYSLNRVEVCGDGFVNGEQAIFNCKGCICIPGSVKNTIEYSFEGLTNYANYNIQVQEGSLKIIDRSIPYEIILDYPEQYRTYTGTEISIKQPEERKIQVDGVQYIVKNIDVIASGKNVGEYQYFIRKTPIVCNEAGYNLTNQFSIAYKVGKLIITPKKIVLISDSKKKQYDGKKLTADGLLIEGLIEEGAIEYTVTGSQSEVGISENTFEYHFVPDELKYNYSVEKRYGILGVEKVTKENCSNMNMMKIFSNIDQILDDARSRAMPFKELYHINELEYTKKMLAELELSTRIMNRLQGILEVHTVGEMLNLTYDQLLEIKGFGKSSIVGIDDALRHLSEENIELSKDKEKKCFSPTSKLFLKKHLEEIFHNNFEFLDVDIFYDNERLLLDNMKVAVELIDEKLLIDAVRETERVVPIVNMLNSMAFMYNKKEKVREEIKKAYVNISDNKRDCDIKWFIYAYVDDDEQRERLLKEFQKEGINSLRDFMKVDLSEKDNLSEIIQFIKWSGYDIQKEVDEVFKKLYKNNREKEIISNRATGNTLDITGKIFGVTRERIRQIEKNVIKRFETLLNANRIILKIFAERNGDEILTPVELSEYFGERTEQMLYLLRRTETSFYTYDSDLDVFVVGSSGLAERAQIYIDKLPEVFTDDKMDEIIKRGIEDYDLTEEIICAHIEAEYRKTEKIYHRSRLTLQSIYDAILKKYYPNGIWIYGEKDILEFRMHIKNDYGNIILTENNRALIAQVCRAGVLCGRGMYKARQSKYISNELLRKIEGYIEKSEDSIFMMNTLFYIFEDELRKEEVDNKYYLQGILHEAFGKKWCFRRDYVSKDDKITSLYTEIVTYIKKAGYPVKKQEIRNRYPGVTEIVLNLATSDSKVLNLFGCYIHAENLKISKEDVLYLKNVVEMFLEKKDSWHCRNLYEYIMNDNPVILKRNYINIPFGVYSLLEYFFHDEYNFSRPYIAKIGTEIVSTFEMLQEVVVASDTMDIADISAYARKNYHQINNILEFLDNCNETHLLINVSEIASIDIIGITAEKANDIENILDKEVNTTMPINGLKCVHLFPEINVPWTEWLIYSVIKKWGKKYEVKASEVQLKQAVALIAPKGKLCVDEILDLQDNGKLAIADDLSNIDNLIEDFELEELELDEL